MASSEQFGRPSTGERFEFAGMRTNGAPDALPPGKYPYAQNIRALSATGIRTRPGLARRFTAGNAAITDMRSYVVLETNSIPVILARDEVDRIWLDNGTQVGTLARGFIGSPGATLIPFRPNASPNPWMYIANGFDYQKFSAPNPTVIAAKVGIAEPPTAPIVAPLSFFQAITSANPGWTRAGGAGVVSNGTRFTDTAGAVFLDPTPDSFLWSIEVSPAVTYQRLEAIAINSQAFITQDVLPPLTTALAISGIYYFTGATGRCIIVPLSLTAGPGNEESSIYTENLLSTLRRGAIIQVGGELCLVWSITVGPDGTVAIETSTVGTHTTADTLTSVPAITVIGGFPVPGATINAFDVTYEILHSVDPVGTQTATLGLNPFTAEGASFGADDYITVGLLVDNLSNLVEVKLLFDVSDGTFTKDFYYYTMRPSDITDAIANTATQLAVAQTIAQRQTIDEEAASETAPSLQSTSSVPLAPGSGVWSQVVIPISSLTRVGSDITKSLQNVGKVQWLWNCSDDLHVATAAFYVFGGFAPDVGDVGVPYQYRVRPRAATTGVKGNASPSTRYGVSPRRASVQVSLPSAAYDAQIDTWDIFRYGGSVTTWRFIGSVPSTAATFTDIFGDDAATAGDILEEDNYEPWPSVDLPAMGTATLVTGFIAVVSTTNTNITSYLPGTLVTFGDQNVFTLRSRPTLLGGTNYRLEFVENAGVLAPGTAYAIQEPFIARQFLPYMWGPDQSGTIFACGDALRPGTLYFAKNYAPDAAPDSYNIEITQPSEPLLGGEVLDGLCYVASPERWWQIYPQPDNPSQRFAVVQAPFNRGLGAPFGHCTDGKEIYWWAKDGIYSSARGSLTDADLYNLFPHDGVPGANVTYGGKIVFAPNYSQATGFRLTYSASYLYATYLDGTGFYRTLVYDLRHSAWSVDVYTPAATAFLHPEQPSGLLDVATFGGTALVSTQQERINDPGGPIVAAIATREFTAGDERAPKQWGDIFLDSTPIAAGSPMTVTPMSVGASVAPVITLPTATTRQRVPLSIGGIVVVEFLGILVQWTDDYTFQTEPSSLHLWQPSYVIQPARNIAWQTFGSSFEFEGFGHLKELLLAWVSTAPIQLTVTAFDGMSPAVITIPSSGGAYQKKLFTFTANKGLIYNFAATSIAPFQLFLSDTELQAGAWARQSPYTMYKNFGGRTVDSAPI